MDHKELYDKTNEQECLFEQISKIHKLSVKVLNNWFDFQRTHYEKLSGQPLKEMMECWNWIHDKFGFLSSHIRCKSSGFKSKARGTSASAASAPDISRASTDTGSVISMWLTQVV